MDAALGEQRELAQEKNHSSSDGLTCSGPSRPEVNSLLTKIADTISTIQQQQPHPPNPAPLPSLPPFDPSALLNSLTSQGASIDSLLDSLTRGTPPLLSSTSVSTSSLAPPHTLPPLTAAPGSSQLPPPPSPSTNSPSQSAPDTHHDTSPPRAHPHTKPHPSSAPRAALAINGVPAVMATVVARSVSAVMPLPPPLPTSALIATALPFSTPHTFPQSTQLIYSIPIPPPFTASPLTTSHLPPPPPLPPPSSTIGLAVAPPTQTQAPPTGNHLLPNEPFISAPLPLSYTANELITQGAPPSDLSKVVTAPISEKAPPPPDVQAIVNELTSQGLTPNFESNPDKMAAEVAPPIPSVDEITSDEPSHPTENTVNEPITQGVPPAVEASPPSLHANEELLSDESDEIAPPTGGLQAPPPAVIAPAGSPSGSASPYTDDASFASFVAGEAHDAGSVMEDDHFSPSPSPMPTMSQSIDVLVSQMQSHPPPPSSLLLGQFGVTSQSPRTPILPPPSAPPAPLDMTVQNFPKRSKYAHRAAMSAMHPYHRTRGGGVNVAKTLDLLKAVLQSSFNMEVKRLCDDYLQLYCQASANIRENTGDTVPEATLRLLVNKMLEEAQHGYQKGEWEFPSGKLPRNEKVAPAQASPMSTRKVKGEKGEPRYGPPKRSRRAPADQQAGSERTSWKWSMDKKRVDPGKWKPDTLAPDTFFVLGVNVNKALGHGANRGKVYYLHPELFKYACDGDDKTWLYENNLLPVHGGKAFLMILKEVNVLVSSEECYRENKEILSAVKKLQEFQVPQFMLEKMKTFMRSVQGYFAQEASATTTTTTTSSSSPAPPPPNSLEDTEDHTQQHS